MTHLKKSIFFLFVGIGLILNSCGKDEIKESNEAMPEISEAAIAEIEADAENHMANLDQESFHETAIEVSEESEKTHYWVCNSNCDNSGSPSKFYSDMNFATWDGSRKVFNYSVYGGMGWPIPLAPNCEGELNEDYTAATIYYHVIVQRINQWSGLGWETIYSKGKYGPVAVFDGSTQINQGQSYAYVHHVYRYVFGDGYCKVGQTYYHLQN